MNVKFCLFLATTAHCHDRAAIKIHITTFNRINLHVCCGNLHNFNCFWLSGDIVCPYQRPDIDANTNNVHVHTNCVNEDDVLSEHRISQFEL